MAKIAKKIWTSRGPTGKRVKHISYGYDLRVNGARERKFNAAWATEADALAALTARLKEVEAGILTTRRDRTFDVVAADYLAAKRRDKKRSVNEDERILLRCFAPHFGLKCRLRSITREQIAQYRERRLSEVASQTVRNELSVLRHLLRCAQEVGDLDTAPVIKLPKPTPGRLRYFDEEEITRLLKACARSQSPILHLVVVLALNTGMRQDEILSLDWKRVNLSTGLILVDRTKNSKPRSLPMNGKIYEALITLQPEADRRQTGRLFPTGQKGSQIRTAWNTALKRAAITDATFHTLRHTFASHHVMAGTSLQTVAELLGHSDLRMVLRYAHLSPAHLRAAVEQVQFGLPPEVAASPASSVATEKLPVRGPINGLIGYNSRA